MYRLTLVKSWNNEELQNYADLVSIGRPDFIEVKVLLCCFVFQKVPLCGYVSFAYELTWQVCKSDVGVVM